MVLTKVLAPQSGEQVFLLVNLSALLSTLLSAPKAQILLFIIINFVSMPKGTRRDSDLYCPIRLKYELTQKNETECFPVLNMAPLAQRNITSRHTLAVSASTVAVEKSEIICYC